MSADCAVELIRKQNIDYTINVKDDERNLSSEKHIGNLFMENMKNKRDLSPSTCQNNADTLNEIADILRINADKKNENNHVLQSDSKRQKTVCYDFKKGICRRRFCRVGQ